MSWVRVPPEAAHFFLGKVTALGVLCCFALFDHACFFLSSLIKNMYVFTFTYYVYEGISDRVSGIAYRGFRNAYRNNYSYVSNCHRLVTVFLSEKGGDY